KADEENSNAAQGKVRESAELDMKEVPGTAMTSAVNLVREFESTETQKEPSSLYTAGDVDLEKEYEEHTNRSKGQNSNSTLLAINSASRNIQDAPRKDQNTNEAPSSISDEKNRVKEAAPKAEEDRTKAAAVQKDNDNPELDDKAQPKGPKVLIVGDSMMLEIGPIIKNDIKKHLNGHVEVQTKVSSGLSRPEFFNWQTELKKIVTKSKYDYILVSLGTNDSQAFLHNGRPIPYATAEWYEVYQQRLINLLNTACYGSKKVFLIGLPPMRSKSFNNRVMRINKIFQAESKKVECADFIALDNIIGGPDGQYTTYQRVNQTLKKVRMKDGIHLTLTGGHIVSKFILSRLEQEVAH
ncbi:MAG: DUF459 domain-containing protein, partial [Oligoflexales bacterium]|nr:DUF459 domain-containing protein [Oligoflexales bacterium]